MDITKLFEYIDNRLLVAVKEGVFGGNARKEITAFLVWLAKNNYGLCPYDASFFRYKYGYHY